MKRVTGTFFLAVIAIIYFIFATKGKVYTVFTAFFPLFHLIFAAYIIFFGLLYLYTKTSKKDFSKILTSFHNVSFFLIPATMTASCLFINLYYIVAPQPDDGIHYVWIAKLISYGKLFLETPHYYEHYYNNFILNHDGKYISIFLPGYSVFLSPFARFGIEFLFNPLIAGINTFIVGIHAKALKDKTAGIIAMVLFAFSSAYILHGAFYFPHHFGLMLVLIATYLIMNKFSNKNIIISGTLLSLLLLIKPQNAIYIYFAITVFLFFKYKKLRIVVFFTIPFVISGIFLMIYNFKMTGHPFVFVQDIYFNILNVVDFCHRPGFGKGCAGNHGEMLPPEGVTFDYSIGISFLRLNNFLYRITAHPVLLIFILPVIFKNPYKYFLYYFTPLCAVFAYFTFYIEGNYAGPRYFLESGALFLIAAGCGISETYNFFKVKKDIPSNFVTVSILSIIFASITFFIFFLIPNMVLKTDSPDNLRKVKELIKKENIENSIVMLPLDMSFHYHSILSVQDNPPHDKHGNLIIYSLGKELDRNVLKFYKNSKYKSAYTVENTDNSFRAVPLEFIEDDGFYSVEFEMKFIPLKGEPQYVLSFPDMKGNAAFAFDYSQDIKFRYSAQGILFNKSEQNYYEFEHSIKNSGNYTIEIGIVETDCTISFKIFVNNIENTFFIPEKKGNCMKKIKFTANLKEGRNSFSFKPETNGCLILDYMDISPTD